MISTLYKLLLVIMISLLLFSACKITTTHEKRTTQNDSLHGQLTYNAAPSDTTLNLLSPDSTAGSEFLKILLLKEGSDYKEINKDSLPFYISFNDENGPYSVYFSLIANDDLNRDGIADYIVERNSEGMLGGNVNSNRQLLYYIMKDGKNYKQKHEILMYAPFSYNIISDYSYKNRILTVSLEKNFRSYDDATEEKSRQFEFTYTNGNVYEKSYLADCSLAKWKEKAIFKSNVLGVERCRSIDMHNFTETFEEKYNAKDTAISAELSGCDNTNASFNISVSNYSLDTSNTKQKKQFLLSVLQSLANQTNFSKEFTELLNYYSVNQYSGENADISDKLSSANQISRQDRKTIFLRINLNIIRNSKQSENWEILTRAR